MFKGRPLVQTGLLICNQCREEIKDKDALFIRTSLSGRVYFEHTNCGFKTRQCRDWVVSAENETVDYQKIYAEAKIREKKAKQWPI